MKNRLFLYLRISVSISLIALLFWLMREELGQIAVTIADADLVLLFAAFLMNLSGVVIMGFRMRKMLLVQRIKLTLKESTYLCFLGYFFNNFFPTSIGGDVVKAYYAGKKSNKKAAAFSGVFMDRLFALLPFTFIPACALLFTYKDIDNPAIVYFIFGLCIFTAALLVLLLKDKSTMSFGRMTKPFKTSKVYHKLARIYELLNIYRNHKATLIWSFSLSLSTQAVFIMSVFVIARAVGVSDVNIGIFFLLVPLVSIISMAPSINGLGVREAGVVYIFKSYIPAGTAFAISLLVLAMLLGLSLIGAFIYAFKKELYSFRPEETEEFSSY